MKGCVINFKFLRNFYHLIISLSLILLTHSKCLLSPIKRKQNYLKEILSHRRNALRQVAWLLLNSSEIDQFCLLILLLLTHSSIIDSASFVKGPKSFPQLCANFKQIFDHIQIYNLLQNSPYYLSAFYR